MTRFPWEKLCELLWEYGVDIPQGHPISVLPKRELCPCSWQQVSLVPSGCWSPPGLALSPILFVIFMDRISSSRGGEGLQFGGLRSSSLLFADDVVLMASLARDHLHSLDRLAAECEADQHR